MRRILRPLVIVATLLALAFGAMAPADAHGRGGWGGRGHWGGPGVFWGGIGLGLGIGYLASQPAYVVAPPVTYYYPAPPVTYYESQPVAAAPAQPAPIFYPRNGQSTAQTEADRQACNRWATTQPSAMNDASVFQRATLACMDGRGYTAR